MKVKVVKCNDPCWWYSEEIGNIFEVESQDRYHYKLKISGLTFSKEDVEVVESNTLSEELDLQPSEPPVRWFVETRKLGHEFFGESWETVVESKPVLQVKFEGYWIDVPVFKSEVFDVN